MDGYQLAAAIRAEESAARRTPIVALTANALRNEAERCKAAGMDDYMTKPTPLSDLQSLLERWLPAAIDGAGATPPQPDGAPLDANVLGQLIGGDAGLMAEFLADFRASATRIARDIVEACARGDLGATVAAAHKLKSAARSVGARTLGELCVELETAAGAGQVDALGALSQRFEAEMQLVQGYLSSILPESAKEDRS
jgi:HPt (histidine-containing phosphotransfer) domain-containing protein